MKPDTFCNLVSSTLYEHRFGFIISHLIQSRWGPYFVQPIVAGLQEGKPVIATYDSIGCMTKNEPIQVGGTAWEMLLGCAETFY